MGIICGIMVMKLCICEWLYALRDENGNFNYILNVLDPILGAAHGLNIFEPNVKLKLN